MLINHPTTHINPKGQYRPRLNSLDCHHITHHPQSHSRHRSRNITVRTHRRRDQSAESLWVKVEDVQTTIDTLPVRIFAASPGPGALTCTNSKIITYRGRKPHEIIANPWDATHKFHQASKTPTTSNVQFQIPESFPTRRYPGNTEHGRIIDRQQQLRTQYSVKQAQQGEQRRMDVCGIVKDYTHCYSKRLRSKLGGSSFKYSKQWPRIT
ncbi:hypothetical protein E6O75_ATG02413 [Venturia nashicola]|uniref:Uncharacterized protein n=1 Tax=Venturia nashicola TaxID=86259 RepID=A0A4Z1P810_9PEZI|nr:hypothetical protein E6O75_ATG02413 [Venturia nashicola]